MSALTTIKRILFEEVDPIRLEYIRKHFTLLRNNVSIVYDAAILFEYIEASGDMCDPIARESYQKHELMRLQRVCGRSLLDTAKLDAIRAREIERRELIAYLTNEIIRSSRMTLIAVEAFENLHSIASGAELADIYRDFRNSGIETVLDPVEVRVEDVHNCWFCTKFLLLFGLA